MEIWKDVLGYEGLYMVSSLGRIKNGRTEVVLKPSKQNSGYLKVNLHSNGRQETKTVHRIVASSFLGIGEECDIHHLDEDKTNNSLSNLEACSHQRNVELSKSTPYSCGVTGGCTSRCLWHKTILPGQRPESQVYYQSV